MDEFAGFQNEVYLRGLAGERPTLPFRYDDLVERAREVLDDAAFGYVAGGAGSDRTMAHNRDAFTSWRLVPRHLRDVTTRDLSTTVLGTAVPAPVVLAPIGVQSIVHPEAELATARAAAALGLPMCLSTVSSTSLERVAEAMDEAADGADDQQPPAPRWFQLYWPSDRELAASLVRRAEAAGYDALVVTLDTKILGWRPWDLATAYLPFLHGEGLASYFSDPVFRSRLAAPPEEDPQMAILTWIGLFSDRAVTWDDLAFLREHTSVPIVVKGVLHPRDAALAVEHGVDGIVVSNHGGRQVDNAVAALDALPDVAAAAGDVPVLFDSGVRGGADALVALALGARAVLLGRPWVWGLAVGGRDGVTHVLRSFLAELDLAMGLTGCRSLADVGPDLVVRAPRA